MIKMSGCFEISAGVSGVEATTKETLLMVKFECSGRWREPYMTMETILTPTISMAIALSTSKGPLDPKPPT